MKKITIMILTMMIIVNVSSAYTKIYDLASEEKPISSGVTYKNIKRFTTTGWLNINVLTVDLTDEYLNIDMLTSPNGITNLSTVKEQVTNNNAVAGVNGEFFSWITNQAGKGYPVGFGMKNGEITGTPYYKNSEKDSMASLLIKDDGTTFYDYLHVEEMNVSNKTGKKVDIGDINKASSDYAMPIIYNRYWDTISPGNSVVSGVTEIVVKDNKVKEIREGETGVNIPEGGYVIAVKGDMADELKSIFDEGDKIKLNVELNINISKVDTAFSGGGMLVRNGAALNSFTHEISGYNPRTAVGTDETGKILYLVTVDGRGTSKGVSQVEMAYLMNELGSFEAVNFDGGGSTAMVGRLPGEESISTLNNPTENRKVVNSIGIISNPPKGNLSELIIEIENDRLFKNHSINFKVKGYDKYINPIEIDQTDISWKVIGVKGTVKDGTFKPITSGTAKLTATYKKVTKSVEIKVMEPATIDIGSQIVTLEKGGTYKINGTVKDVDGYTAQFNMNELTFTASNNYCKVSEDGIITAEKVGQTLITAKFGDVKAFIGVVVSGADSKVADGFEQLDKTFSGYPASDVEGKVSKVNSVKHDGKYSLKLTYDFSGTSKTRGAYAKYKTPIEIPEDVTSLKMWTYTKKENDKVNVKMQILDAENKEQLVTLGKLDFSGWNELELDTSSIKLPAKLERIYVAQVEGEKGTKSEVYFDNLTMNKISLGDISKIKIPQNTKPEDMSEKEEALTKNSISFGFYGNAVFNNTLMDKIRLNKLNILSSKLNFMLVESGNLSNSINISGYNSKKEGDTLFVTLNNIKDGLRTTDVKQWNWFLSEIDKNKDVKNLFIILPKSLDNFSDAQEKTVFEKAVKEYIEKNDINLTILHPADRSGYYMQNGIKYITIDVTEYSLINDKVENDKYIKFVINGENVTYQILSIF